MDSSLPSHSTALSERPTKRSRIASQLESQLVPECLSHSLFLTTTELGRLLLLTSKSVTKSASAVGQNSETEDSSAIESSVPPQNTENIWKFLCTSHWGQTQISTSTAIDDALESVRTLKEATGIDSYERLFRTFAFPPASTDNIDEVRPLQFAPADYALVAEARAYQISGIDFPTGRGPGGNTTLCKWETPRLLFCEYIPGETIPGFFETGYSCISCQDPIMLGPSASQLNHFQILGVKYSFKLSLMRLRDRRVVDLIPRGIMIDHLTRDRDDLDSEHDAISASHNTRSAYGTLSSTYHNTLMERAGISRGLVRLDAKLKYKRLCFPPEDNKSPRQDPACEGEKMESKIGVFSFELFASDEDFGPFESFVRGQRDEPRVEFAHFLEAIDWSNAQTF